MAHRCPTRSRRTRARRRIAAVGRLAHQKGFDRLLRALPAVIDAVPDVHLDLLGDGPEGPTLAAAIEQLGLGDHVTMHGHVPRATVAEYVRRSRFLVAPSRFEGLPYAALEAAGNARAIVATRVAGTEDVVEHGTTGILIDNDGADTDSDGLAAAIIELLRDPERAEAMGLAGRARTERLFSLDACVDAYLTTYRCALEPIHDVAVVIPVHNGERHLAAALDSALADIEASGIDAHIVVVDDGSTDGSAEIARRYADRGVVVFTQPQLGAAIARNAGIALTTSTWIAHLDADDRWPTGRLRSLLDAADDNTEAVYGRAVEFADADAPANARIEAAPPRYAWAAPGSSVDLPTNASVGSTPPPPAICSNGARGLSSPDCGTCRSTTSCSNGGSMRPTCRTGVPSPPTPAASRCSRSTSTVERAASRGGP